MRSLQAILSLNGRVSLFTYGTKALNSSKSRLINRFDVVISLHPSPDIKRPLWAIFMHLSSLVSPVFGKYQKHLSNIHIPL